MSDKGHENLMNDIDEIRELAEDWEFHDFKNTKFATPKIELYKRLIAMANKVKEGRYDN